MLHRLTRAPAGEEGDVAEAAGAAAHIAAMEAEEVEALASLRQVHDPRLGPFQVKPKLRQGRPQRHKGSLGLWRQVSKSDPTDLYEQVAAEIARAIADREAKPGERLLPPRISPPP
jgi:hypothetical protein